MKWLPCILCGEKLEQRTSRRGKPYFCCNGDGIQLFIRRKQGIERLSKLIAELENQHIYSHASSPEYLRILAILNEIAETKAQVKKIEKASFFVLDKEQTASVKALEKHMQTLVSKLESFTTQEHTKS